MRHAMTMPRHTFAVGLAASWLLTASIACESDPNAVFEEDSHGESKPAAARPAPPPPPPAAPAAAAAADDKPLTALVYKDEDFLESLRNRDPFKTYSVEFKAKVNEEMQRRVIMPATAVEEMILIAIVTGMPRPKAMLTDTAGVGHVVERGDYIGRPRLLQAAGSVSMALNWRVDRIRENEVVLTQQDPTDPTRSALTKIIALSPPGEEGAK